MEEAILKFLSLLANNAATIATLISLIFVAIQTRTLRKTYEYNCDWQEKEKAAELAQMYKNDILPSVSYIGAVLKETGIMDLLSNINGDNIEFFNQTELFRLTNRNISERIDRVQNDFKNISVLFFSRQIFRQRCNRKAHNINPALIKKWIEAENKVKDADGKEIVISDDDKKALLDSLWFEYTSVVSDTLNDLEYFAMNFISGVADDSVVFQSLHQTYITLVQLLYYDIAIQNEHEKDKFYTNIIALYKKWREIDSENEKKVNDAIEKSHPVRK